MVINNNLTDLHRCQAGLLITGGNHRHNWLINPDSRTINLMVQIENPALPVRNYKTL